MIGGRHQTKQRRGAGRASLNGAGEAATCRYGYSWLHAWRRVVAVLRRMPGLVPGILYVVTASSLFRAGSWLRIGSATGPETWKTAGTASCLTRALPNERTTDSRALAHETVGFAAGAQTLNQKPICEAAICRSSHLSVASVRLGSIVTISRRRSSGSGPRPT